MTIDQLPAGLPMDDKIEAWANDIIREVAELPDRNSPEGQPEMMLVSADELRSIIVRTTPEGFVLVPVEPTPKMSAAGFCVSEADHDPAGVYRAMLAASQESWT